jgi:chorismate synthase
MSLLINNLGISVFGESHGYGIGITIHNFPANVSLDIDRIKNDLQKRTSFITGKSTRTEKDEFEIISGFWRGVTTGAPLTFLIRNKDVDSTPYLDNEGRARPSHGDYTSFIKYQGANDFRGGGHLSGRLTALYVILGSICQQQLERLGIKTVSRIKSLHNIEDDDIIDINQLSEDLPVYNQEKKQEMINLLDSLVDDSVGGIIETYIQGVVPGVGNPLFNNIESLISRVIFSIPAVKGIEFGKGFAITKLFGSIANDQMQYINNEVHYLSNNSGGIQGGITNGNDIVFRTAIKPTASIGKKQNTINYITKENIETAITGRHDKSIMIKAVHVVNAMASFAIYDILLGEKNG